MPRQVSTDCRRRHRQRGGGSARSCRG